MRRLNSGAQGCNVILAALLVLLAYPGQYTVKADRDEVYQEKSTSPFSKHMAKGFLQKWDQRLQRQMAVKDEGKVEPEAPPVDEFMAALKLAKETGAVALESNDLQEAGIVISGGGRDVYARAMLLVKFIREELNCDLPIEVAYVPDYTTSAFMEKALKSGSKFQGKKFIADFLSAALEEKGDQAEENLRVWNMKTADSPLASKLNVFDFKGMQRIVSVLHSRFQKVIYMNVENLPLISPATMLEWTDFKRTGSLFWPGLHSRGDNESPKEGMWEAAGLQSPWQSQPLWRTTDSGQFLIDKKRHAGVMGWVARLASMDGKIYNALGGEPGLWELAFALDGKFGEFNKLAHMPRIGMSAKEEEIYEMQATIQNSQLGVPVFLQRTNTQRHDSFRTPLPPIQWITVPLPNPGWHAFAIQEYRSKFGLHDQSTIYPDDAACDSVDVATASLFAWREPERWNNCTSTVQGLTRKLPVALLPLAWYPAAITSPISQVERAVLLMVNLLKSAKQPRSGVPMSQYTSTGVNYTANFLQDQPEYKIGKDTGSAGKWDGNDGKLTDAVAGLFAEHNWLGDGGRASLQEVSDKIETGDWEDPSDPVSRDGSHAEIEVDDSDSAMNDEQQDSGLYMVSSAVHLASPDSDTLHDPEPASRGQQSAQKDPGKEAARILAEGRVSRIRNRAKLNLRKRNMRSRRLGRSTQS